MERSFAFEAAPLYRMRRKRQSARRYLSPYYAIRLTIMRTRSGVNEMMRVAVTTFVVSILASAAFAQTTTSTPASGTTPSSAAATRPSSAPAIDIAATQFKDEAAAKAHCPTDTVVWLNTAAKVYHLAGNRYYGTTKKGTYICKQDADHRGFRIARGELVRPAPPPTVTKP
jgi:hypothetical protein